MRSLLMLFSVVSLSLAQVTFVYPPGYPKGCQDEGPANQNPWGGKFKYGNKSVCPAPAISIPAKGESKGYVDPNLGHKLWVSADIGYVNTYSTPSPLSATGKYVALGYEGYTNIADTKTGEWVRQRAGASQDWGFWWHSTDDETYFTVNGATVRQISLKSRSRRTVLDMRASGAKTIWAGGTGDLSRDHWLAFSTIGPPDIRKDQALAERVQWCAAPLDGSGKVYCTQPKKDLGLAPVGLDFFLIAKGIDSSSGKRYVVVEPWGLVLSVDEPGGKLKREYRAPEHPDSVIWQRGRSNGNGVCEGAESCLGGDWDHADTVEFPDGTQWLFASYSRERNVFPDGQGMGTAYIFFPLAVDDPQKLATLEKDGGAARFAMRAAWWGGRSGAGATHYSCARNEPVCAVAPATRIPKSVSDKCSPGKPCGDQPVAPFAGEVIAIKALPNSKLEVHRLAKHRSLVYEKYNINDYYSLVRGGLSGDGSLFSGATNFGLFPPTPHPLPAAKNPNGVRRQFTVETGIAPTARPKR